MFDKNTKIPYDRRSQEFDSTPIHKLTFGPVDSPLETVRQRNLIIQMAGMTIIGMPLIALVLDLFIDSFTLQERLLMGENIFRQLGSGLAAGIIFGVTAKWIVKRPFLSEVNTRYSSMIEDLKLNSSEIVFISLCAGVGEEVLFRGALQPWVCSHFGLFVGILMVSVGFVAVHGYLNPKNWRLSIYGIYMTIAIFALGFMAELIGLWSAVVAHTVIDIYLLRELRSEFRADDE